MDWPGPRVYPGTGILFALFALLANVDRFSLSATPARTSSRAPPTRAPKALSKLPRSLELTYMKRSM